MNPPWRVQSDDSALEGVGKEHPCPLEPQGRPENIIGYVRPASMREVQEGLYVEGRIDLERSEAGRHAWRAMKDNAVALSFGFMAPKSHKRSDGVRELLEIDLFEVSIVPGPANADTRFLSLKAIERSDPFCGYRFGDGLVEHFKSRQPVKIATWDLDEAA